MITYIITAALCILSYVSHSECTVAAPCGVVDVYLHGTIDGVRLSDFNMYFGRTPRHGRAVIDTYGTLYAGGHATVEGIRTPMVLKVANNSIPHILRVAEFGNLDRNVGGMLIDGIDDVYFVHYNSILKITQPDDVITEIGAGWGYPSLMASDRNNAIYVQSGSSNSYKVRRIEPGGSISDSYPAGECFRRIFESGFDEDDNFFYAAQQCVTLRFLLIRVAGNGTSSVIWSHDDRAEHIVVDSDGSVYVLLEIERRVVFKVDPSNNVLLFFNGTVDGVPINGRFVERDVSSSSSSYRPLHIDLTGNIIIASYEGVVRISPEGVASFIPTGGIGNDLQVDMCNNVYASRSGSGGSLFKVLPNDTVVRFSGSLYDEEGSRIVRWNPRMFNADSHCRAYMELWENPGGASVRVNRDHSVDLVLYGTYTGGAAPAAGVSFRAYYAGDGVVWRDVFFQYQSINNGTLFRFTPLEPCSEMSVPPTSSPPTSPPPSPTAAPPPPTVPPIPPPTSPPPTALPPPTSSPPTPPLPPTPDVISPLPTCAAHACRTQGVARRTDAAATECDTATGCDDAQCCSPLPACDSFSGCAPSSEWHSRPGAALITCSSLAGCVRYECCAANPTCATNVCPPPATVAKVGAAALVCLSAVCADADCCDAATDPGVVADTQPFAQASCASFACPREALLRANAASIVCAEPVACTELDCCEWRASCFASGAVCGGYGVAKAAQFSVVCAGVTCRPSECCDAFATCDAYACSAGYPLPSPPAACAGAECTDAECCAPPAHCATFNKTACLRAGGYRRLDALAFRCAAAACTAVECCVPFDRCDAYACSVEGNVLRPDAGDTACAEAGCGDHACCEEEALTCWSHVCQGPRLFLRADANNVTCADGAACTDGECCVGAGVCSEAFECPGDARLVLNGAGEVTSTCAQPMCADVECCTRPSCASFTGCRADSTLRSDAWSVTCAASECVAAECCSALPVCTEYTCSRAFSVNKFAVGGPKTTPTTPGNSSLSLCDAGGCTDARCCAPPLTCVDHVCPNDAFRGVASRIVCSGVACSDRDCCSVALRPFSVSEAVQLATLGIAGVGFLAFVVWACVRQRRLAHIGEHHRERQADEKRRWEEGNCELVADDNGRYQPSVDALLPTPLTSAAALFVLFFNLYDYVGDVGATLWLRSVVADGAFESDLDTPLLVSMFTIVVPPLVNLVILVRVLFFGGDRVTAGRISDFVTRHKTPFATVFFLSLPNTDSVNLLASRMLALKAFMAPFPLSMRLGLATFGVVSTLLEDAPQVWVLFTVIARFQGRGVAVPTAAYLKLGVSALSITFAIVRTVIVCVASCRLGYGAFAAGADDADGKEKSHTHDLRASAAETSAASALEASAAARDHDHAIEMEAVRDAAAADKEAAVEAALAAKEAEKEAEKQAALAAKEAEIEARIEAEVEARKEAIKEAALEEAAGEFTRAK